MSNHAFSFSDDLKFRSNQRIISIASHCIILIKKISVKFDFFENISESEKLIMFMKPVRNVATIKKKLYAQIYASHNNF